LETHLGILLEY